MEINFTSYKVYEEPSSALFVIGFLGALKNFILVGFYVSLIENIRSRASLAE